MSEKISEKTNLNTPPTLPTQENIQNQTIIGELLTENTPALGNIQNNQQQIWNNIIPIHHGKKIVNNGNTELITKLHTVCRLCLIEDDNLRQIFDETNCIVDMLFVFTSNQLTDDGLPWKICFECLTILTKCVNFRQQIETAQAILDHYMKQGFSEGMVLEKIDEEYLEKYGIIQPIHYELDQEDIEIGLEPIQELNESENDALETIIQEINLPTIEAIAAAETNNSDSDEFCIEDFNDAESSVNEHEQLDVINQNIDKNKHEISKNDDKNILEANICGEDKYFKCKSCKESFSVKEDLIVHGSVHMKNNNGKYSCKKCTKEFDEIKKMKRHIKTHFVVKPFQCQHCTRGFPEMASLTRHVYGSHLGKKKERKFACNLCDKKYFDSYSLNVHIRTHNDVKPFECSECDKRFTDIRLLNSHRRTHSGEKKYKCQHCDKRFTHQSTLTTHVRTHTGEKPYVCIICNASFIQTSNLRLHMRSHSKEKPYICDTCSKGFVSSSALTMHKRCHTKEKPYACPHCDKNFSRSDLSSHIRTHTKERPFICEICAKTFTTASQLKIHLQAHSGELPFICKICQKSYANAIYLKKHMKIHKKDLDADQLENKNKKITGQSNNCSNAGPLTEDQDNDPELNESLMLMNNLLAAVAENDLGSLV